jgi:6-phosphofructokinase 2
VPGTYLLKPSVNELSGHAGRRLTTTEDITDAAHELLRSGPNHAVLVSLAAAGTLLVTADDGIVLIDAPPLHVISAIGAGDSLVAGVVMALERGCNPAEAARQGVAAGTAATMATGHTLCQPADVDRLLPLVRLRQAVLN